MAHGNNIARAFDGHDARHARAGKHVALFGAVLQHHGLRLGMHENGALGDGNAMGLGLVGHVDHTHLALGVHVRQLVATSRAGSVAALAVGCADASASLAAAVTLWADIAALRAALVASAYLLLAI